MSDNKPYILVFGISIYDIFGFTDTNYRSYDSNPGRVKVSYGGVCRNIAENMARTGVHTKFISILGDDEKGKSILEHAKSKNIDMRDSLIIKGASTPTYVAILDETGEMVSAVVDIKIADKFSHEFIDSKEKVIKNAEYMFVDADNPEIIEYMLTKYKEDTRFVLDPVSAAKAEAMKPLLPYFHTIKPNRHEAEVLCGFEITSLDDVREAGQYFMSLGVKEVFISLDVEGIYYNNGKEEGVIKANNVDAVNVTGAGDSFIAGMGYGYMHNLSIKDTVKLATAMSVITISHEETIHPDMNEALVKEYVENLNWMELEY